MLRPRANAIRDGSIRHTWEEVEARVARLAGALRGLGLARGGRVGVMALNGSRYFEILFAVPWAGGVVVPINTRLAPSEIRRVLLDAGVTFLLVDDYMAPLLEELRPSLAEVSVIAMGEAMLAGCRSYEALIAAAEAVEDAGRAGDDLASIYYTGGTTGGPNGVMLSHANLVSNALNMVIAVGYSADTSYLHVAPMFHLADGCATFGVTFQGGSHVFIPRFNTVSFFEAVARERVTTVSLVPTIIRHLVDDTRLSDYDLSSLKDIQFGASSMPEGLLRRALAALPHSNFHQAWGMTELSPIACIMPREYTRLNGADARLGSCGQPMPTVEVRVLDAAGEEVERGTTGEVVVRGPTVMLGYWNKPELTASVLRGGWLHSGDLGYMDEEGFVYIVDRLKDMIITGGENVYSTEVESVISLYEGVAEVAVIGVPHELWGEAVHAVVVPRAGHSLEPEALIEFCRARLAHYKCPLSLTVRPETLPLSGTGKVLKSRLREPFWRESEKAIG